MAEVTEEIFKLSVAVIIVAAISCFIVAGAIFFLSNFGNLKEFVGNKEELQQLYAQEKAAKQPNPAENQNNQPPLAQADPEAKPQSQPDPEADPEHIDVIVTPTGTLIAPVTFKDSDCTCGNYHLTRGNGYEQSLICQYDGIDQKMDETQMDLSISQQYTLENLKKSFENDLANLHTRADNSSHNGQNYSLSAIQNDDSGFSYVETTSYTSDGKEGWCGEGNGVFLVNNAFQVSIDLRSCKLASTPKGYVEVMEKLESCAREITGRMTK